MRVTTLTASLVACVGAGLASLCCLLPLTVIVLGLGSRGVHGDDDALPLAARPSWDHRHHRGLRLVPARATTLRRNGVPDGGPPHHACVADLGKPRRTPDNRARPLP